MLEYLDVLDENGNLTGIKKARKEVHRDGDWHRTVHIWIINEKGEILLQRRCADKDSYPNMLDISCGGHLSAGDSSIEGAKRELKEELNLDVDEKDLKFIKTIKHNLNYGEKFINNQFEDIYYLEINKKIEELKFQEEEISEIIYVPYTLFKRMIKDRQEDLIMRDEEFEIITNYLDSII